MESAQADHLVSDICFIVRVWSTLDRVAVSRLQRLVDAKKKCKYFRQKQRKCLLLHNIQQHIFQPNSMNEQNRELIPQTRLMLNSCLQAIASAAHIVGIITALTPAVYNVYAVYIKKR